MLYTITRNGEVLFEFPWFKDVAKEWVRLLDTSKAGDYLTLYYVDKVEGKKMLRRVIV